MRQRLSSKFVNWVPVKGKDFYNEFFYNGKIKKEELQKVSIIENT